MKHMLAGTIRVPEDGLGRSVHEALCKMDGHLDQLGRILVTESRYILDNPGRYQRRLRQLKEFGRTYSPWSAQEPELLSLSRCLDDYIAEWPKAPRRAALNLVCSLQSQREGLIRRFGKSPDVSAMSVRLSWIATSVRQTLPKVSDTLASVRASIENASRSGDTQVRAPVELRDQVEALNIAEGDACESLADTLWELYWGDGDTRELLVEAERKVLDMQSDPEFERIRN